MGPLEKQIREKIEKEFSPVRVDLENESHKHQFSRGPEGHFKLLVVSEAFEGLRSVERHQRIFALVDEELRTGVHALTIKALTPAESEKQGIHFESPACLHGLKE